uniref:Uncharacterized protein n=1 Tax=viral metagenome TaxID=1070528 RepID=A0A6M3KV69_9ZZZZ
MALHRRDSSVIKKGTPPPENVEDKNIKAGELDLTTESIVAPVKKQSAVDIYWLRDYLAKIGEASLVRDCNRIIDFYNTAKINEAWSESPEVMIKNVSMDPYITGRYSILPDAAIALPDFEVARLLRDFPGKFEVQKDA